MLLSDLRRINSRLSKVICSVMSDSDMEMDDDDEDEEDEEEGDKERAENNENSTPMQLIEETMKGVCKAYQLDDLGDIQDCCARQYAMYVDPKNASYIITVGSEGTKQDNSLAFYYTITDEDGIELDGGSAFQLKKIKKRLIKALEKQGALPTVQEEDQMEGMEEQFDNLDLTHHNPSSWR
jgi:TATA-binding protein-associated factor Taf7